MDALACPQCGAEMVSRALGRTHVDQCPEGHGVFLRRAALGDLIDAENSWHSDSGHHTMPLPRITADMSAPPPSRPVSRAYIETLFA